MDWQTSASEAGSVGCEAAVGEQQRPRTVGGRRHAASSFSRTPLEGRRRTRISHDEAQKTTTVALLPAPASALGRCPFGVLGDALRINPSLTYFPAADLAAALRDPRQCLT